MFQGLKALVCVVALAAALPVNAQSYRSINSLEVVKADANVIEVIGRVGAGKEDYWCSVGDYVRRVLQLPWKTEIYVVSDISRSVTTGAKSAARFTLHPEKIGIEPYESNWIGNVLTVGYSRSVTAAFDACYLRRNMNIQFGWP